MSGERGLAAFVAGWPLFADAALSAAAAGALLGALGVWVVLCEQIFLCAALGQAAALGVAVAFWARPWLPAGLHPLWGAAASVLAGLRWAARRAPGQPQVRLGVLYLGAAAGVLALGSRMAEQVHDIQSLLFGSAVAVSPGTARGLFGLAAVGLGLLAVAWRGMAEEALDPDGARVRGLPVRGLAGLRVGAVAVALTLVTGVLGALPAFAFGVLPALAALRLAPTLGWALASAAALGAAAGLGGYFLAFAASLPVGAAQALVGLGEVALGHLAQAAWRRRKPAACG